MNQSLNTMTYKGVTKGKTIELEERLPYAEGQLVSISVDPLVAQPQPGSPAAIRQVMHDPPLAILPCEPVPEAAGDHYARVRLTRQRKGLALDENDLWIAATALASGTVFISRDSDFQQVDELMVEERSKD